MFRGSLFFHYGSCHEPQVHCGGGNDSVVVRHDAEAFHERASVVLCGHSAVEVVGHNDSCVFHWQFPACGGAHDSYAPVVVGREAVAQVVGGGM